MGLINSHFTLPVEGRYIFSFFILCGSLEDRQRVHVCDLSLTAVSSGKNKLTHKMMNYTCETVPPNT